MQKTVLMDSETISRKVLSGLVQEMDEWFITDYNIIFELGSLLPFWLFILF